MSDSKCSECGCTVPPDATKCPNCLKAFGSTISKARSHGDGITVGRIGYAIVCPVHGKLHITANIASEPTRCPFC